MNTWNALTWDQFVMLLALGGAVDVFIHGMAGRMPNVSRPLATAQLVFCVVMFLLVA